MSVVECGVLLLTLQSQSFIFKHMQPFVHLHVHSQYSILDGQASIPALVDKAIANGMRGIAITDHGNMFGIKEFFNYVEKKNGDVNGLIKSLKKELDNEETAPERRAAIPAEIEEAKKKLFIPIFGCEMYVSLGAMTEHIDKKDTGRHLVVLAKNEKGYHNLVKLVSLAWTDGFYSHPRIDKEHLEKYHEGLIICSACLGGEIPRLIQAGEIEKAREVALWFKGIWGDDYYLELQRHKATVPRANHDVYPRQVEVNEVLMRFSKELGIKLVCTNDVHFVNEEDGEAHDRLICVSTGKYLNDEKRMLYSKQEWMKTQEEMNEIFADVPEALSNTLEVLDKVELYSINHKPILPNFPLPPQFKDNDDYLRYLVYEGAKKIWGEIDEEHRERLDFELATIKNMGFPGYFLIVQDFIKAARNMGVSVGPGRGSAAGSAVAYCLEITKIDPIKYDLLFERFLNPDRISLPDIDIDFDDDGRSDVLHYVIQKYGAEKVARIITFGAMAAKSAIKDVARVEQLPLSESDRLSKMIPDRPNALPPQPNGKATKITIKNCVKYIPELQAEYNSSDPLVSTTLHYAEALEGNVRNTGVHACGVIICRDDITDWVPLSIAYDKDGSRLLVTQYEGSIIEDTGLIKMDFLGLKTLSIIKEALNNIRLTHGIEIDPDKIDITDKKTYQLYCEGRTTGTFQFESAGMQKYLRELQPTVFEDLIAMNALYRPGPMDYIPQFIARKQGREPITYDIPEMEKYLKDTYGITVYQEQVMLLSRQLAGFTRGESDGLRKAMGKKLIEKLNSLKSKFMSGGQERGHDSKVLEKIWADWEKFASYAFNKSHATCYSWVAFQTAYFKANYPSEYMAAVLSRNLSDITTLTKYMDECKAMKISVLGPDVNESRTAFSVNKKGDIRFGLGAIKGVGVNAVTSIIEEREKNGPFTDIFNFVERVNLASCNRKTIESLATAGAFDCFEEVERESFTEQNAKGESFSEILIKYGQRFQASKQTQMNSLFGDEDMSIVARPQVPKSVHLPEIDRLERERELVGMYLSGHPLDPYYFELQYGCNTLLKDLPEKNDILDTELTFGGFITEYKEVNNQAGKPFGVMKLEDFSGTYELRLYDNTFYSYRNYGRKGTAVIVRAKYQRGYGDRIRMVITGMDLLDNVKGKMVNGITINILDDNNISPSMMDFIADYITDSHDDSVELRFNVWDEHAKRMITLVSARRIQLKRTLINYLDDNSIAYKIK